jgi:hypothetical protein
METIVVFVICWRFHQDFFFRFFQIRRRVHRRQEIKASPKKGAVV